LCVELAVQRGWVLCDNFVEYIVTRDEPCKQWLISEGHYTEPSNDERKANVGSGENTGVHIVSSVGNGGGAGDGLSVGASSDHDLADASCIVTGSDASGADSSRHRYCVVM